MLCVWWDFSVHHDPHLVIGSPDFKLLYAYGHWCLSTELEVYNSYLMYSLLIFYRNLQNSLYI